MKTITWCQEPTQRGTTPTRTTRVLEPPLDKALQESNKTRNNSRSSTQTHAKPAITGDATATFLSSKIGVSARSRNTTDSVPATPRATRVKYGNGTAHKRTAGRYGPSEYPYMHPS